VATLPATTPTTNFTVSWSGSDGNGSGIASYQVYVSDDGAPYTLFHQSMAAGSATYAGQMGHTYDFYCVATDNVGNVQATPTAPQAETTVQGAIPIGATFVVTDTSSDPNDTGSLPYALEQADAFASSQSGPIQVLIQFNIPAAQANLDVNGDGTPDVFDIQPSSTLVLNNPDAGIILDAASEVTFLGSNPNPNGGPAIYIDGASSVDNGLYVSSAYNQIGGLVVENFTGNGIELDGATSTTICGNVISDNGQDGIILFDGAADNVIGGTSGGDGNVISGNGGNGVEICDASNILVAGNVIDGNLVGVNIDSPAATLDTV